MLNGISKYISPELLKVLSEMGHTDEIVFADLNFPALTYAKKIIRLDGVMIPEVLKGVLKLFPLDTYADVNAVMMKVPDSDPYVPKIFDVYNSILMRFERGNTKVVHLDKPEFYARAEKAVAVVVTGEKRLYANLILKKGVVL